MAGLGSTVERLILDGVEFANVSGIELERGLGKIMRKVPEVQPPEFHGKFNWDNGMLTAIDKQGKTHVSVNARGLSEALEKEGFQQGPVPVYCNNGESPVTGDAYGQFTRNFRKTTGKGFLEQS